MDHIIAAGSTAHEVQQRPEFSDFKRSERMSDITMLGMARRLREQLLGQKFGTWSSQELISELARQRVEIDALRAALKRRKQC